MTRIFLVVVECDPKNEMTPSASDMTEQLRSAMTDGSPNDENVEYGISKVMVSLQYEHGGEI